jgi:cobalamin-dependent methionine synthase I
VSFPDLSIIGERINPGFKSTRAMFESDDFAAIQALAMRQAEAGAAYLNVNCGRRALDDPKFLTEVIHAIQAVVDTPLSFDFPNVSVQEVCLKAYDIDKAKGRKPIVNSIAETRLEMLELARIRPFRVILMASERLEDGRGKPNRTTAEMVDTTRRVIGGILGDAGGFEADDLIVDVSISALAADMQGLTRMTLDAIAAIASDPDLRGVHLMGGLSNIGQQMPGRAADGTDLKLQLENAFLTLACPLGFDFILGTPWRSYQPLPPDNPVLQTFGEVVDLTGMAALRAVRRLYRAG